MSSPNSRLEELFACILASNPLTDNRSVGPDNPACDVAEIHQAPFERVARLVEEAGRERRSLGIMLFGEAGVGKSHLLARLGNWASRERRAWSVSIHNLQSSPANLPRALLRAVVANLTAGRAREFYGTPLYQMLILAIVNALGREEGRRYPWEVVEREYGRLVDALVKESLHRSTALDRSIFQVLYRFLHSARAARSGHDDGLAAIAVRWLGGEALDAVEGRRLGLIGRPEETIALADNQQVKQVFLALTQLARLCGRALLLCIDQVDNLDPDQAGALARFLEASIDGATNLVIVTAGIQATLLRWRADKVIQDSAWDRLAQFETSLLRIPPDTARQLLQSRMRPVLAPFLDLPEVARRCQEEPLFPLPRSWAGEFFKDRHEFRPRDVLSAGREGWRLVQERIRGGGGLAWFQRGATGSQDVRPPARIEERVARQLAELEAQRHREPLTLVADPDSLAALVGQLLEQWRQAEPACPVRSVQRHEGARGQPPMYNLLATMEEHGTAKRVGIRFLMAASARTMTFQLRRLARDPQTPERVLLVLDADQPPRDKGVDYLQELRDQGETRFRVVELTFADRARLDALHAVVALARSGDLEIEEPSGQDKPLTEADVLAAHQEKGRFRSAPILRELANWPSSSERGAAILESARS